jgi:multicomponent Na+:H+ antiporter subunit E
VRTFLLNILLGLLWTAVSGPIDEAQLALGFILGYLVLWTMRPVLGETRYFDKLPQTLSFIGFFLMELALANWRVAIDVLSPRPRRRLGVVAVPLELPSDAAITLLANLITLTPGSISLDVSEDRGTLYVHTMFLDDPDSFRREVKEGFERRVLELLR